MDSISDQLSPRFGRPPFLTPSTQSKWNPIDELIGGYDEKNGKKFKIEGYLEEFALIKNEAEDLIMNARNIVFK